LLVPFQAPYEKVCAAAGKKMFLVAGPKCDNRYCSRKIKQRTKLAAVGNRPEPSGTIRSSRKELGSVRTEHERANRISVLKADV